MRPATNHFTQQNFKTLSMHLKATDIKAMEKIRRLNIINAITGIKPANLIGTASADGQSNLAIFSSVVHLGSNPALLGFIVRPSGEEVRHTYENIKQTCCYTINQVHTSFAGQAHYTSAKFERGISEFEACGLTEEYVDGFAAPFVKESVLKIGLELRQEIPIELNGTTLIIGEVAHLILPDDAVDKEGHLNLQQLGAVGISGLNSYYSLHKLAQYPYARPDEVPHFQTAASSH
jgi:flavin reductase (DIM6/NTAB) family NADH-FMN oxidoreductase RutF